MKKEVPNQLISRKTGTHHLRTSAQRIASGYLMIPIVLLFALLSAQTHAQGTWTKIAAKAPDKNGGGMLVLSDGTVLAKSFSGGTDGYGNLYDKLTPDIHGSYINGTWSTISKMISTRLYYSSQILKDGRVYVAGGEYGSGNAKGETYDPLTDVWTACPNQGKSISDANSEIYLMVKFFRLW